MVYNIFKPFVPIDLVMVGKPFSLKPLLQNFIYMFIINMKKELIKLLPNTNNVEVLSDFSLETETSNTYKINQQKNNINGFIDDIESVKQSVYLILNIERYKYLIYDWDYGFEIVDLIGKDINIIQVDIQRRICDALKQDDRITDIKDFSFEVQKNKLIAYFTVETIFGSYEMQDEFTV